MIWSAFVAGMRAGNRDKFPAYRAHTSAAQMDAAIRYTLLPDTDLLEFILREQPVSTAYLATRDPGLARAQWNCTAETIFRLADSLPRTERLREICLSTPPVRKILARQQSSE